MERSFNLGEIDIIHKTRVSVRTCPIPTWRPVKNIHIFRFDECHIPILHDILILNPKNGTIQFTQSPEVQEDRTKKPLLAGEN